MAKRTVTPAIKLTDADKKMLTDLEGAIETSTRAVNALKEMGVDTKSLEEKLEFSVKTRDVLLKEFT